MYIYIHTKDICKFSATKLDVAVEGGLCAGTSSYQYSVDNHLLQSPPVLHKRGADQHVILM